MFVVRIDYAYFFIIKNFDKIIDFFFLGGGGVGGDRQILEKEVRFEL